MIETQHLSKLYSRGVFALRDLSITIDKGEFVFLTGPSGAGKSSFLRLLLRESLPTDGSITVSGRNLADLSPRQVQAYRRGVGFVFQDFKLIPRKTVLENVSIVPRVLGAPVSTQQRKTFQVLKWVGLQHRMNSFPLELSGGEQQRIAIARALVNDPTLILADEPTGNLDPDLSLDIMNLLREVNARGTTVVVATHDRELIRRVGRRAIALDHGRLIDTDERAGADVDEPRAARGDVAAFDPPASSGSSRARDDDRSLRAEGGRGTPTSGVERAAGPRGKTRDKN